MSYNNPDILQDIHNYGTSLTSREIFLHNFYGSEESNPGVEYRMANTFLKNITVLNNKSSDNITIHMHSIGENGLMEWLSLTLLLCLNLKFP